jgi:hypothetical protein
MGGSSLLSLVEPESLRMGTFPLPRLSRQNSSPSVPCHCRTLICSRVALRRQKLDFQAIPANYRREKIPIIAVCCPRVCILSEREGLRHSPLEIYSSSSCYVRTTLRDPLLLRRSIHMKYQSCSLAKHGEGNAYTFIMPQPQVPSPLAPKKIIVVQDAECRKT